MEETTYHSDPSETVQYILGLKGDPSKWIARPRGFVDWKFSELCEYLGYPDAHAYASRMQSLWYDYPTKFQGRCLLDISFTQFKQHEKTLYIS